MAVLVGANSGTRAAKDPSGGDDSAIAFGVSASITLSAASANIALPTDANGKLYPAYQISATETAWFVFCTTGADAAVIGAANTYLVNGTGVAVLVATPQAQLNGQVGAFIAAIASGAGFLNVVGIF
jgi:invasion protein IalB